MDKIQPATVFPFAHEKEILKARIPKSLWMSGDTGLLAGKILREWLIDIRESNPSILTMFRDRDTLPYRDLLPWSGEFAGKHIISAYYIYLLTRDESLFNEALTFLDLLISYQAEDGYLGVYSKDCRLTGSFSQNPQKTGQTWDAWNHYHIMYGLYLWSALTERKDYENALLRIADRFLDTFYDGKSSLASIGSTEMNLAPFHIFALLYRKTGEEKYLRFAKKIEEDIATENAGDYIRLSLQGIDFYKCPKPRWESLHVIQGIAEMYLATGEEYYLTSAAQITNSILKTDVHNTGAFSTDEQAVGNPYQNRNVETCCVVAFNALTIRLLHITEDIGLLDFLERSHYNAVLGFFSPTGKWSTYNTPMDGCKRANFDEIQFQSRAGSPQLNCCSVNAPRGVGEVAAWMFTEREDRLCVNFYESFDADFEEISLSCRSDYPAPGRICLHSKGIGKKLALRIPGWSKQSVVTVNGERISVQPGTYFEIDTGSVDTEILLDLDFSPCLEEGDLEYKGKSSVYAGPVLYGAALGDNRHYDLRSLPKIEKFRFSVCPERQADGAILWRAGDVVLRDFYHLGADGSAYRTWLEIGE